MQGDMDKEPTITYQKKKKRDKEQTIKTIKNS